MLHEAEDIMHYISPPPKVNAQEWDLVQQCIMAYICLYIKQDIYSLIALNTDLPTFKHKWDKLKDTYASASGSTTAFNLWRNLNQSKLINSKSDGSTVSQDQQIM